MPTPDLEACGKNLYSKGENLYSYCCLMPTHNIFREAGASVRTTELKTESFVMVKSSLNQSIIACIYSYLVYINFSKSVFTVVHMEKNTVTNSN